MGKKVLITGGAGFIGSHLVDEFVKRGDRVTVIDNLSSGYKNNLNNKAIFFKLSLSEKEKLRNMIKKIRPNVILHLAATSNIGKLQKNPSLEAKEVITGISILTDKKLNPNLEKIIFFSSAAIYAQSQKLPLNENARSLPISYYGTYKLVAEHYLINLAKSNNIRYVIFRLANIYGPMQRTDGEAGVIATFIGKLNSKKPVVIHGDGSKTRDFLFVDDVVSAVIESFNYPVEGIYNLGTSCQVSILDLAKKLFKIIGVGENMIFENDRPAEIEKSSLSYHKFAKYNWKPRVNLETGLKKTIDWFNNKL